MSDYPEHDKLLAVKDQTQAIGEFIEWVRAAHGAELMVYFEGDHEGWYSIFARRSLEKLLAEWSGIDLKKIDEEKRAMLEVLRKLNEEGDDAGPDAADAGSDARGGNEGGSEGGAGAEQSSEARG